MKININSKEFQEFSSELSIVQENKELFLEEQEKLEGAPEETREQEGDLIIQHFEQKGLQKEQCESFQGGSLAESQEEPQEESQKELREESQKKLQKQNLEKNKESAEKELKERFEDQSGEKLQEQLRKTLGEESREKLSGKSEEKLRQYSEEGFEEKSEKRLKEKSREEQGKQSKEYFREPLMKGKRGIIFGLANDHSLAWGIAQQLYQEGAEMAFTYQGPLMEKRVVPLAKKLGSSLVIECDVSQDHDVKNVFDALAQHWDSLDFIVHSVSFSDKNELRGAFIDTTRHNFLNTMAISCYSFVDMVKHGSALMKNGGSILTLTYYGSEKVIPHYNVMGVAKAALETSVKYAAEDLGKQGIRVNALSCGPIKTLAASGIGDFRYILQWNQHNSPLRRTITLEDAGKSALFLLSDLSSGVTGENLHVDCGYHVVGMKAKDAPDIALPKTEDSCL